MAGIVEDALEDVLIFADAEKYAVHGPTNLAQYDAILDGVIDHIRGANQTCTKVLRARRSIH
jgi:hypothetical protein